MSDLVTMATAKGHLRITHSDDDADIAMKITQASDIILDYIKNPEGLVNYRGIKQPEAVVFQGSARYADGVGRDTQSLVCIDAYGPGIALSGGWCDVNLTGAIEVEFRGFVAMTAGSTVVAQVNFDGGPLLEVARTVIATDGVPQPLVGRIAMDVTGQLLGLVLVPENNPTGLLSFNACGINIGQTATGTVPVWTPGTVPSPIQAAVLMMLEKLYDDRSAGQESNQYVALGYLTPPITAILHRFRHPAMA